MMIEELNLSGLKQTGSNQYQAKCPCHDDRKASLSITTGDGEPIFHCHAGCNWKDIKAALGLSGKTEKVKRRISDIYEYKDESGKVLFESVRFENKQFRQRIKQPDGSYLYKLNGVRRVLYRLPELLSSSGVVYIAEGEKDAENLISCGLTATCNPMGAGKWRDEYNKSLKNREVVILPDNDKPGKEHAQRVAKSLYGIAKTVKILELPNLPKKGDVSDWFKSGGDKHELIKLAEQTPQFKLDNVGITEEWPELLPLNDDDVPSFPTEAIPEELIGYYDYCKELSEFIQIDESVPIMAGLGILGAALAKKIEIEIKPGYREPANLFILAGLASGERKSATLRAVSEPLEAFEKEETERLAPLISKSQSEHYILSERLKEAQRKAAKAKPMDRLNLKQRANDIAEELRNHEIVHSPVFIADDATPESISNLLANNGGRLAVVSAEGGIFDIAGGRYTKNGGSNIEVFLKGHAGDPIRVNRVSKDRPSEYISDPALSVILTVQPEVIRNLTDNSEFKGKGLCARFLYVLPQSKVGYRSVNTRPVSLEKQFYYKSLVRGALELEYTDDNGEPIPHILRFDEQAQAAYFDMAGEFEKKLRPGGELGFLADWGSKLPGAACRLAGIMHSAMYANTGRPGDYPVDYITVMSAFKIAEFLIPHAQKAFSLMGLEPVTDIAQKILSIIESQGAVVVSKRDIHYALKGSIRRSSQLDEPLKLLVEHGYVRPILDEKSGPGRPSERYEINPELLGQKG